MNFFSGIYQHAVDGKGRTSLPAKFRDVLAGSSDDKLFITTDLFEPCLLAYAPAQWNAFTERVAALPQFSPQTRHLIRTVIAPAQECPFDKVGRILLPPPLRDYAGLADQVVWVGANGRIEVWAPAGWEKAQAAARSADVQAGLLNELKNL